MPTRREHRKSFTGTSVNHGSLENVKPVTIMGFNNNLGTYVEYKGQVEIELDLLTFGLDCVMEKFYIYQEWVRSGYKALTKYGSLMEWREIPKQPNLNRLFDTFQQLSSIKQTPNSIRYSKTVKYTDDQLGSQIKQFAESYNVSPTNIKVMTEKLRNLDSELEKQADNLLKQIHCAQFNVTCTLNKILRNKMKEDFNITISDFLKGSAVKIGKLDNNTLAFEYKIPKIDNDQLSIYRLTPIPKVHGNGTIEILDTKTPYVAVDNGTDRYFELHDLENCLKLEETRFICKPAKVSTIKHTEDLPCGMAAILNQSSVACTSHLVVRQSLWTTSRTKFLHGDCCKTGVFVCALLC
ncbi:uncharacterized protein [Drosophila kikkawai]|uniref:Uncharacterized protein isoform X2 n=1 Tax=Drosophila kikkawai TaxID=30033 RepID=A0ABM4GBD8_DROKI